MLSVQIKSKIELLFGTLQKTSTCKECAVKYRVFFLTGPPLNLVSVG